MVISTVSSFVESSSAHGANIFSRGMQVCPFERLWFMTCRTPAWSRYPLSGGSGKLIRDELGSLEAEADSLAAQRIGVSLDYICGAHAERIESFDTFGGRHAVFFERYHNFAHSELALEIRADLLRLFRAICRESAQDARGRFRLYQEYSRRTCQLFLTASFEPMPLTPPAARYRRISPADAGILCSHSSTLNWRPKEA